jgi:hypothetical protein
MHIFSAAKYTSILIIVSERNNCSKHVNTKYDINDYYFMLSLMRERERERE